MLNQTANILVVEDDADVADMLVRCLRDTLSANVTYAQSAADALREELTTQHHLIVMSLQLGDVPGLDCMRELRVTNACPIILLADNPSLDETIEAMRLSVVDLFCKPFDMAGLCETARQAAEEEIKKRHERTRSRRLRRLASRIIRERRELHQRMDLLCQDFVYAYRRVAQRVSEADILTHSR